MASSRGSLFPSTTVGHWCFDSRLVSVHFQQFPMNGGMIRCHFPFSYLGTQGSLSGSKRGYGFLRVFMFGFFQLIQRRWSLNNWGQPNLVLSTLILSFLHWVREKRLLFLANHAAGYQLKTLCLEITPVLVVLVGSRVFFSEFSFSK